MGDSDEYHELIEAEERFQEDVKRIFGARAKTFSEPLRDLLRVFWEQAQRTLDWKEGETGEDMVARMFPSESGIPAVPLPSADRDIDNLLEEMLGDDA